MSKAERKGYDLFKEIGHEEEKTHTVKKWIRAKEGQILYSMGRTKLVKVAREAGAVYKLNGTLLIDTERFENYLETFRVPGEYLE